MRVAIAGAGAVGRSIARELLENGHEVLLIDQQPSAIKVDSVPRAEWLLADACEISSLDDAALDPQRRRRGHRGDDKVNLVVALLAKTEYGVPRVVARVNHPGNEWLYTSRGVSTWPSDPAVAVRAGREAVSVGDLVRLMTFGQSEASLVELTMPADAPLAGKQVGAIAWPADAALVAILREGRVLVRSPRTRSSPATSCSSSPRKTSKTSWNACSLPARPGRAVSAEVRLPRGACRMPSVWGGNPGRGLRGAGWA